MKTPAVGLTAAVKSLLRAVRVVCGRACCRRHRAYCLRPCALLLRAMRITAARVVCGRVPRRCGPCVSLLGLQYSHVIEKK